MIKNYKIRQRGYAHFDRALSSKAVHELVNDKNKVAKHAFWPLIVSPMRSVYRKNTDIDRRETIIKNRPIAYAAHSDSYIYTHYAQCLSRYLEEQYKKIPICNDAVLAYRVFEPPKSNINFAFEVFTYIQEQDSCEVITLDVEGFFDNLDHFLLKKAWIDILPIDERSDCGSKLRDDHYAVFKACTHCYGVELSTLRDIFGGEVRKRRGKGNAVICSPYEFRKKVAQKLKPLQTLVNEIKAGDSNPVCLTKGIPQGLPISAVLANLYMLETDKKLTEYVNQLGGIYRRYSDDILLVVPSGKGSIIEHYVLDALKKIKLNIQPEKTRKIVVTRGKAADGELGLSNAANGTSTIVSYLGFDFDGKNIYVRQSSVSKFMMMAERSINNAIVAASVRCQPLKKRKLYTRLTSLGYGKVYGGVTDLPQSKLPQGIPRLGFFKYLSRAAKITSSKTILKQKAQIKNQIIRKIKEAEIVVEEKLKNCK